MATATKTPYEILGTSRNSTNNQLLVVYRTKIHEHLQNKISPADFSLICRAHETLSDYTKRKQYDSLKKWVFKIPIDRYTPQQLAAEPHLLNYLKKHLEQASLKEINAEDPITGHTTLYCAARAGNVEAVQFLIELGAEPDLSQRTTSTALHVASCYGHARIVRYLLENGADYRIVNSADRTAEEEAYGNDVKRVFAELKRNPYVRAAADELDWFQKNGLKEHIDTEYFAQRQTLLHCACKKGYPDMVRWLVEQCSANIDLVDSNGNSPLHLAVYGGHLDIVEYLLNCGCNSTLRNQRGATAEEGSKHSRWIADLFESMHERDMFEMARTGIDWWFNYYFDVQSKDMVDSNGVSLLCYACRNGQYSVAKWLLEHGATVNIQMITEPKSTPLDTSIVELLLEYGLDVNIKNDFETIDVDTNSHEYDEQQSIVELKIDDTSVYDDQFQTLSETICDVQYDSLITEHSPDLQQTDAYHQDTGQVTSMLSEEKPTDSSILETRTINSDDSTLTFTANCTKNDNTSEITRFYRSDLQNYDLPNTIYLLKTIIINSEKSDTRRVLLLASISHQSDLCLYMLTMPLSCSFSSDTQSNQLSIFSDIHAFIPHVNIISIDLMSPAHLFIADDVGQSLKTLNNFLLSTYLTFHKQDTNNTLPRIDYYETNINVIRTGNRVACTFSNQNKPDCTRSMFLNSRVYYTPKIPYVMSFTCNNQKPKAVRKRTVKRNNSRTIKCTTIVYMNQVPLPNTLKSTPHWSSQRLILSSVLKWPPWLHLLHRMDS